MGLDVSLEGVTKNFESIVAVKDVSLYVERNEFFSILGPSGCGKTTLLRIIAGLETPNKGIVKIGGRVVNNDPPHKRGVGLVFQGTAIFPHMNVFDNIAFGLRMRGYRISEIKEKVENILKLMNMPPELYANKRVDQLSGGERQRIEIARSLIIGPEVLLLDEPLGPLDLKIRQRMQVELKRLQKIVGTTFIYVTHDQTEAISMSDRLAVMNRGEIVQVGTPEEIYLKPANRFVAEFIGEPNLIKGRVSEGGFFLSDDAPPIYLGASENLWRPGDKGILMIRPERIVVGNHSLNTDNKFMGIIVEKIYSGIYTVMRVKITDNLALTVYVYDMELSRSTSVGDKVSVGWNSRDVYLIKSRNE